jgi:hypothetical protein
MLDSGYITSIDELWRAERLTGFVLFGTRCDPELGWRPSLNDRCNLRPSVTTLDAADSVHSSSAHPLPSTFGQARKNGDVHDATAQSDDGVHVINCRDSVEERVCGVPKNDDRGSTKRKLEASPMPHEKDGSSTRSRREHAVSPSRRERLSTSLPKEALSIYNENCPYHTTPIAVNASD